MKKLLNVKLVPLDYKYYFKLLRFRPKKGNLMVEDQFLKFIITDILSSEEYTLPGIAYYTNTPEDVIYEIASGRNKNPSFRLSRKIVDLHRKIKPELYARLISKIRQDETPLDGSLK